MLGLLLVPELFNKIYYIFLFVISFKRHHLSKALFMCPQHINSMHATELESSFLLQKKDIKVSYKIIPNYYPVCW